MTMVPCLNCGTLVNKGAPHLLPGFAIRCPTCTETQQQRHNAALKANTTQRGYGHAWRNIVRQAIADQPWCSNCGAGPTKSNPLTGDHIVPKARGGTNHIDNVQVLCRRCNSSKGARPR